MWSLGAKCCQRQWMLTGCQSQGALVSKAHWCHRKDFWHLVMRMLQMLASRFNQIPVSSLLKDFPHVNFWGALDFTCWSWSSIVGLAWTWLFAMWLNLKRNSYMLRIISAWANPTCSPTEHPDLLNPHMSNPAKPQINTRHRRLNILASLISVNLFCVRWAVWLTHSFNMSGESTCCGCKTTNVTAKEPLWSPQPGSPSAARPSFSPSTCSSLNLHLVLLLSSSYCFIPYE